MAEENKKYQITTRTGEVITLNKDIVRNLIAGNQQITDQEFVYFFQLCKVNKVNPFLREAYLIKYGTAPATIVLDYKVLQQIAANNPQFVGMEHGVIVTDKNGKEIKRIGAYKHEGETLVAGWCKVKRKDRETLTEVIAMFSEFAAKKADGTLNTNWTSKPCFMIEKVAKAQALREAFPNDLGSNVYTPEEMSKTVAEHEEEKPKDARETHKAKNVIDVTDDGEIKDEDKKPEAKK